MVRIPTVLITPKDPAYRLERKDFEFVRSMIVSARRDTEEQTSVQVRKLMRSSLKFGDGTAFRLSIGVLEVDLADFHVRSTSVKLSPWDVSYMRKLITCAAASSSAMIVMPSYITVSNGTQPPKPPRKVRAPRRRKGDK